jgi:hypothetical protein
LNEIQGQDMRHARCHGLHRDHPGVLFRRRAGSFILSYGKLFKLQSDELDWLVVTIGDTAYIQGTASIRGEGSYPFRATFEMADDRLP